MNIGIIGAGNIGGNLTRRFQELGHKVFVANSRGPESLADLAAETGATPVSVHEAARRGDVVIVTIPEKNISDLPRDLFAGVSDSVVVVNTDNYYPQQRDGRIAGIEDGMIESRWVSQQLGRPVVKAFNNIYAEHLLKSGRPAGTPGRIALPVAGDDDRAKSVVLKLVDELGFDGGRCRRARRLVAAATGHSSIWRRFRCRRSSPCISQCEQRTQAGVAS